MNNRSWLQSDMDDDNAAKSKTEKKSKGINSGKRRFNGEEDDDEVEEEGCDVEELRYLCIHPAE